MFGFELKLKLQKEAKWGRMEIAGNGYETGKDMWRRRNTKAEMERSGEEGCERCEGRRGKKLTPQK